MARQLRRQPRHPRHRRARVHRVVTRHRVRSVAVAPGKGLVPEAQRAWEGLRDFLLRAGEPVTMTSGFRTHAEQLQLYTRFIAGKSKYPVARPGTSKHETGRAFDIAGSVRALQLAAAVAPSFGLKTGVSYGDPIHFEV